ncbi:hypothetical protein C3F09_03990 [candidate division GN15 bacterium]|uniref:Dockerin domain-containing protein n=1 Tax=candidate division GN15 bacterium TaxID=2072418 RepID=A0A855X529_9BACT|nr:MAG: hypothetical protein C3F09_03990 [candidate division GN15 bacterium]
MKSRILLWSLVLVATVGVSALAADKTYWQLLVSYDQNGINIVEAGPIPPTHKQIRTPGIDGAPVKLAYDLQWLDGASAVLSSTSTDMPLGVRVSPSEDNLTGCRIIMPEAGMFVIRVEGPDRTAAPSAVRLSRTQTTFRALPGLTIPPAFEQSTVIAPIQKLATTANRTPGPIAATKLRDTGPDNNRLVLVILGDGYTATNLSDGMFTDAVNSLVSGMDTRSPWDALLLGTNIYRIDVESNEQGADRDSTQTNLRDTYFNSSFWVNGIERLLAIDGTGYSRAVSAANSYVGYGLWDFLFILVNSTKYGGSGGSIAVSSVHPYAPEILLHETGHTFAGLADEYSDAYPGYPAGDPEPNVDYDFSGPALKWLVWVTPGVPLPTPPTSPYLSSVGAFEGARYLTTGIYRPMYTCEMKALDQEFCPVCKEAHINRYTNMMSLLDGATPAWNTSVMLKLTPTTITLNSIPIGPMHYAWRLNGVPLSDTIGSSITLTTADYYASGAVNQAYLDVEVTFPTDLVRQHGSVQTYRWITYADCNNNGVSDIQDIVNHTSQDANGNFIPDECDALVCCEGVTGNVNLQGIVDLSDLSALISYLTGGGYQLPCYNEANVNGSGIVDLSDLSALISYLTGGGYLPPNCP